MTSVVARPRDRLTSPQAAESPLLCGLMSSINAGNQMDRSSSSTTSAATIDETLVVLHRVLPTSPSLLSQEQEVESSRGFEVPCTLENEGNSDSGNIKRIAMGVKGMPHESRRNSEVLSLEGDKVAALGLSRSSNGNEGSSSEAAREMSSHCPTRRGDCERRTSEPRKVAGNCEGREMPSPGAAMPVVGLPEPEALEGRESVGSMAERAGCVPVSDAVDGTALTSEVEGSGEVGDGVESSVWESEEPISNTGCMKDNVSVVDSCTIDRRDRVEWRGSEREGNRESIEGSSNSGSSIKCSSGSISSSKSSGVTQQQQPPLSLTATGVSLELQSQSEVQAGAKAGAEAGAETGAEAPSLSQSESVTEPEAMPPSLSVWSYLREEIAGECDDMEEERGQGASTKQSEARRARVFNTMVHVPWRCELLIMYGYLVCLDAVLYHFAVVPVRLIRLAARMLPSLSPWKRQCRRLSADDVSDVAQLLVALLCLMVLLRVDLSLLYHWIRGQAVIKLLVIFNVLEVLDKLCQSLGSDVLQMLFNSSADVAAILPSATSAASSPSSLSPAYHHHRRLSAYLRLAVDATLFFACSLLHSAVLLLHAVTLNVAVNSHNHVLLAVLVSNNFTEVKSHVFKRFSKDNLSKVTSQDIVERFHLSCHVLFVIVQSLLKGQGASLDFFLTNVVGVWASEVIVDVLKHAFLAKFNDLSPDVYSSFLHSMCKQVLQSRSRLVHRSISFIALPPVILVLRAVSPIASLVRDASSSSWLAQFCMCIGCVLVLGLLLVAKAFVGLSIHTYAQWFVRSYEERGASSKLHKD